MSAIIKINLILLSLLLMVGSLVAEESSALNSANIDSLSFHGNNKTRTSFLEKFVHIKEGEKIDSSKLQLEISNLIRLPSVAHAWYKIYPSSKGNTVEIHIQENFTIIPSINVYTSTNESFAARTTIKEYNLLGRNMQLGALYQRDIYNSYGASFSAPFLFNRNLGLAFDYKNFTTREPVFLSQGMADYKYNNESFTLSALGNFNFFHDVALSFSLFTEKYNYLEGATAPGVPRELLAEKHLIQVNYNFKKLKYHFQYLEGFKSLLTMQYVGTTSYALPNFFLAFNDFIYYKRVKNKGNWASRARLGFASNNDSPFAPFSLDNNVNIRGVGNIIDRGTASIVFNSEYRHSFIDKKWFSLQGNAFIDMGSWRKPGGDFSDFSKKENIEIYPGLGVRFIHKKIFGAIFRIDYGISVTKSNSHGVVFGVGQYF